MRGPLPEEQRTIIHELAENHKKLTRKVEMTKTGYVATTTSEDKNLAEKLKKHFRYMKKRLKFDRTCGRIHLYFGLRFSRIIRIKKAHDLATWPDRGKKWTSLHARKQRKARVPPDLPRPHSRSDSVFLKSPFLNRFRLIQILRINHPLIKPHLINNTHKAVSITQPVTTLPKNNIILRILSRLANLPSGHPPAVHIKSHFRT
ncbi:hypothetical protein N9B74_02050, partial [bacterium]|nr:hypothetical protein [bacterium]